MTPPAFRHAALASATALLVLGGCTEPVDLDMRGNIGAFNTSDAARGATANRPAPDARGVISYPNYDVVVTQKGETVAEIAARLGFNANELGRYNGISPDVKLRAGEIIALPRRVGPSAPGSASPGGVDIEALANQAIDDAPETTPVETEDLPPAPVADGPEPLRHKVARGETIYTISRLYQVPVQALAEWNGLGPDFAIREGQYLLIPQSRKAPPKKAEVQAPAPVTPPGSGSQTPTPPSATKPLPENAEPPKKVAEDKPVVDLPPQTAAAPETEMGMPVKGRIVRTYKKGKNEGIDIAASPGAAVSAAADGTVAAITKDADDIPILVIRHPGNLLTVYANISNIAVAKDQSVKRGQKVASLRGGDDAYVHFEVRDGFDSVDPMPYLE